MLGNLKLAVIGCGNRAQVYTSLIKKLENRIDIVAAADIIPERVKIMGDISDNPHFKGFQTADELLANEKLADVVLIATQDDYHYFPCKEALQRGYDVILEKPISCKIDEILELQNLADSLGRKVVVCHVLRYTPLYTKIKEIIESDLLGEVITFNANEGVGLFHQAHSYVRGKWAISKESSPMILAKCCHDMDIMHWLLSSECAKISSFGSLRYFNEKKKPGAVPARCVDGCEFADDCYFNALKYAGDYKDTWLPVVFDNPEAKSQEEIIEWLKDSPWGRCVFGCDNDVVDHQVVNMEFKNSVTGTFTMTAFESGRHIEIYGTKASLRGGETYKKLTGKDIIVTDHETGKIKEYVLEIPQGGNESHGGGDVGFVNALYDQLKVASEDRLNSSLKNSVHSHIMSFAAEVSRLTGQVVDIDQFTRNKESS